MVEGKPRPNALDTPDGDTLYRLQAAKTDEEETHRRAAGAVRHSSSMPCTSTGRVPSKVTRIP